MHIELYITQDMCKKIHDPCDKKTETMASTTALGCVHVYKFCVSVLGMHIYLYAKRHTCKTKKKQIAAMLAWVALYVLAIEVLLHVYMYVSINNNRSWDLIRGETMPGWEVVVFPYIHARVYICVCLHVWSMRACVCGVCLCVCVCVCVCVCIQSLVGLNSRRDHAGLVSSFFLCHTCVCVYTCVHICVCNYVCVYVCVCVYNLWWNLIRGEIMPGWEVVFLFIPLCVYTYVYIRVCASMCVCVLACVCIYTIVRKTWIAARLCRAGRHD